jgi:hypothetical protein
VTFCKTIPFVSHIDLHPEDKLPEKRKNIFLLLLTFQSIYRMNIVYNNNYYCF